MGENIPKRGKMYQNGGKYTKSPQNIPNGIKIYPHIHTYYSAVPSKTYPN
jgi:hypothetical protein